jgi:hypothetical protein
MLNRFTLTRGSLWTALAMIMLGGSLGCGPGGSTAPTPPSPPAPAQPALPPVITWTDGVALGIVYDTSGSMGDAVVDGQGNRTPKYQIANRALTNIVARLEQFAATNPGRLPVQAGLYVFAGTGATEAVPMGALPGAQLHRWLRDFRQPQGNTPLGRAVQAASQAVLKSPMSRKHVLVISDGMNNSGPDPASVLPQLQQQAAGLGTALAPHFIAFDVSASVFNLLKRQGITVVEAGDETQLNRQLEFILEDKILLEKEEPRKTKP